MRRPEVAVASAPHSSASVALALRSRNIRRMHLPAGLQSPSPSSHADTGGWSLPPLNHFMTLPRRFMPASFGSSMENRVARSLATDSSNVETAMLNRNGSTYSAAMDNLLNEEDATYLLPPIVHYQGDQVPNDTAASPVHHPDEIDLTVSSEDDEEGRHNVVDSSDVVEIVDISEPLVPLCRKRRRSGATGNGPLISKRQRITDMMKSAESTNINMQNSEVVEEFKRRLKCSICLDVLEDMTSTLCGHIFCAACIYQAIRANGKCPLCQRCLHLKDTHRLYF